MPLIGIVSDQGYAPVLGLQLTADFNGVVRRMVVDDQYFGVDAGLRQNAADAGSQVSPVIVTGDDDLDRAQSAPQEVLVAFKYTI
jgi:hypothetical protein